MARKETLTMNGKHEPCVNLDSPVGPTSVLRVRNLPGDVMLVQSVFHILAKRLGPTYIGFNISTEVPQPNGRYDEKTERAILQYQKSQLSSMIQADGVIDPASYRHRNIHSQESTRFMTITQLHIEMRVLFDTLEYADELIRNVPQLGPWLR